MQSFVTNRRTNSTKKYQVSRKSPYDNYKENLNYNDKLQITDDYSRTLSTRTTGSSNIVLRLSESNNYSIDDATTQSYKLTTSSSKQKSFNSEIKDIIVISDSSDDDKFIKNSIKSDNFKKLQKSSICISSSSDESDKDDFILKYNDQTNTLNSNAAKRRISNNFKPLNTFKTRQRCSILYTSDDTASTASTKSKSSSSQKKNKSPNSSISHISATPYPIVSNKSNEIDKPISKAIDKLKNQSTTKATTSPSFCSTKYQKLFPRKINKNHQLSKAEALKILKVVKSKQLNYFSASDSEKSQISDSFNSPRKRSNGAKKSNIINETDSEKSKSTKSSENKKTKSQKSNIINETDSDKSIENEKSKSNIIEETDSELEENNPKIQKEKILQILQIPPTDENPGYNNLSARKRKEIANWIMLNNPDANSESSFSHISGSNRNSVCSGNSSLERLEVNYETPNNRGKFLKLHSDKKKSADESELKTPIANATDVLNGLKLVDTNKRINNRTPLTENRLTISTNTKSTETSVKRQTRIDEYLKKTKTISGKSITVITPRNNVTKTPAINSKPEDVKIEDCVDILDKLYGDTWRAKADVILSEPRKKNVVKKDRGVQTERKTRLRLNVDSDSEEDLDFGKFVQNVRPTLNSTRKVRTEAKTLTNNRLKRKEIDSFINDNSSSDGSVPSSYYTAVTNHEINYKKKITDTPASTSTLRALAICDPESDEEPINNLRNNHFNRKKLSYSDKENSSSSTSEFDPEDIIHPKTVIKKPIKKNLQHVTNSLKAKAPAIKKTYSFLASLNSSISITDAHQDARVFRENFKKTKEVLCQRLFAMYNEKIFDNKLPKDMLIDWSTRMRGTAGFCYNKKSIKSLGTTIRSSRIVLSTKVLDRPDRLRDTLVHELCHAASWIINELSDGHGPIWKGWAKKAMKAFPELPPVSVCHNYKIHTKYTYKCTNCGYSIGRHSKSLDVQLKRCGYCYGKFELFINRTTKSGNVEMKTPSRTKDPSAFALYVKENYQNVKQNRRSMKHGEVMKVLGQQFSSIKIAKQQN
ncbi:germ cell nuclear acidic protein-like [Leptopilina boulardi]|uniref:germ cell nuclear acidic protein-like n=1 Tax=Leptopilina boulardi TaxID=63433 RepID=UPI0021F5E111|nr:germ cell nuclear acidic protein-like [Leptopilina boulardi]